MDKLSEIEHNNRHVAHYHNTKEKQMLDSVSKYWDKCKDEEINRIDRETRELRKHIVDLRHEKRSNDRIGSCLSPTKNDTRSVKSPMKKLPVKLKPGAQLDPDRMSPPSSHDVALRMLHDKHDKAKKKKKSKKSIDKLQTDNPSLAQKSWHHSQLKQGSGLKLPDIDSKRRRKSIGDPENVDQLKRWSYIKSGGKKSKKQKNGQSYDILAVHDLENDNRPQVTLTPAEQDMLRKVQHGASGSKDNGNESKQDDVHSQPTTAWGSENKERTSSKPPDNEERRGSSKLPDIGSAHKTRRLSGTRGSITHSGRRPSGRTSFSRGSRGSTAGAHMQNDNSPTSSLTGAHRSNHRDGVDKEMLEHYYQLLTQAEKQLRRDSSTANFPTDAPHLPKGSFLRSQRRKALALDVLMKQLPSFRNRPNMIDPMDSLNCRYLRLTKNNIEELEEQVRGQGTEPGLHAHVTESQVLEFFRRLDEEERKLDAESLQSESSEEDISAASYLKKHSYHH